MNAQAMNRREIKIIYAALFVLKESLEKSTNDGLSEEEIKEKTEMKVYADVTLLKVGLMLRSSECDCASHNKSDEEEVTLN